MQGVKKRIGDRGKRGWLVVVTLIFIWLLNWSLIKDFSKVRKGFARVDGAYDRLAELQKESGELKRRIAEVETGYYQEKLMRDKLSLQLPGETVVVLPEQENAGTGEDQLEQKVKRNWEKWWNLIR